MADINERKRDDNDTGKAVENSVGVVSWGYLWLLLLIHLVQLQLQVLFLAERRTTRRGKVPLMTTIMAPKQEIRIK